MASQEIDQLAVNRVSHSGVIVEPEEPISQMEALKAVTL